MNSLLGFLMSGLNRSTLEKNSVIDINDADFKKDGETPVSVDQFEMYYSLLADSDGWCKAMPQAGLEMRGLYPLVYQVISNYGSNYVDYLTSQFPTELGAQPAYGADGKVHNSIAPIQFHGPSMRMPAIDTAFVGQFGSASSDFHPSANLTMPDIQVYSGDNTSGVPPCYVGMIVLPPAKLNQLYYRLKVTWTIEFTGLRSLVDIGNWDYLQGVGAVSYGTDYADQSTKMASITNMVDTNGADIHKVMEGC